MAVRLHNLSSQALALTDAEAAGAVAALIHHAHGILFGVTEPTAHDVQLAWQTPGFDLKRDAWAIATRQGRIVAYADVRQQTIPSENIEFIAVLFAHPDYRGRGIGTLLLWLVEERARQMAHNVCHEQQVSLHFYASRLSRGAKNLLERDGYSWLRSFWRVTINVENIAAQTTQKIQHNGKVNVDMVVGSQTHMEETGVQHTELYVAHQYDVYEKVLRLGSDSLVIAPCFAEA